MPKKKKESEKKNLKKNKDESKVFAWLASFFTIVGFVLAIILKKDDEYVMYYAKQGLVLFVGFAIAGIFQIIPVIGQLFLIFVVVLWIFSWVGAISGKRKNVWLVQDLAEKIKL
jgi:uncharacterized membrane protein